MTPHSIGWKGHAIDVYPDGTAAYRFRDCHLRRTGPGEWVYAGHTYPVQAVSLIVKLERAYLSYESEADA